jgi:hypothetical protein
MINDIVKQNTDKFLNTGNHNFKLFFSVDYGCVYECLKCNYLLYVTELGVYFTAHKYLIFGSENLLNKDYMLNCNECIIKSIIE